MSGHKMIKKRLLLKTTERLNEGKGDSLALISKHILGFRDIVGLKRRFAYSKLRFIYLIYKAQINIKLEPFLNA